MCLIGSVGPYEPSRDNLWKFLLPFVLELRAASRSPIFVRTPKFPSGSPISIVLGALCCDSPARTSVTGRPSHTAGHDFCLRCEVDRDDLGQGVLSGYFIMWVASRSHSRLLLLAFTLKDTAGFASKVFAERRKLKVELAAAENAWRAEQNARTTITYPDRPVPASRLTDIRRAVQESGGRVSALDILPNIDKFQAATHDPMHMLLLGLSRTFLKDVLIDGEYPNLQFAPKPKTATTATVPANPDGTGTELVQPTAAHQSPSVDADEGADREQNDAARQSVEAEIVPHPPGKKPTRGKGKPGPIQILRKEDVRSWQEIMNEVSGSLTVCCFAGRRQDADLWWNASDNYTSWA